MRCSVAPGFVELLPPPWYDQIGINDPLAQAAGSETVFVRSNSLPGWSLIVISAIELTVKSFIAPSAPTIPSTVLGTGDASGVASWHGSPKTLSMTSTTTVPLPDLSAIVYSPAFSVSTLHADAAV